MLFDFFNFIIISQAPACAQGACLAEGPGVSPGTER